MMRAIRRAFRVIWEGDSELPFVRGKLVDLGLVAGTGVLAVAAFGLSLLVEVLAQLGRDLSELIGASTGGRIVASTAQVLASLLVTFAVFFVLYRTVPPARPRFAALWPASLLGSAAFQVATAGYAFYLAHFGNVTSIYGPLGAALGFLLVLYVGVLVLLLGAELVAAWPEPDPPSQGPKQNERHFPRTPGTTAILLRALGGLQLERDFVLLHRCAAHAARLRWADCLEGGGSCSEILLGGEADRDDDLAFRAVGQDGDPGRRNAWRGPAGGVDLAEESLESFLVGIERDYACVLGHTVLLRRGSPGA